MKNNWKNLLKQKKTKPEHPRHVGRDVQVMIFIK